MGSGWENLKIQLALKGLMSVITVTVNYLVLVDMCFLYLRECLQMESDICHARGATRQKQLSVMLRLSQEREPLRSKPFRFNIIVHEHAVKT